MTSSRGEVRREELGSAGLGHAEQGVHGWSAQSRGRTAGARRARARGVGHVRLVSHGPCVGRGGDPLSAMELARGARGASRCCVAW